VAAVSALAALFAGGYALYRAIVPGYPPEVAKAHALCEAGEYGRAFMDLNAYSSAATEVLRKDHARFMSNLREFPLLVDGSEDARKLPGEVQRAFRDTLHPEAGLLLGEIALVHTPEVVFQLAGEDKLFRDTARRLSGRGARALLYAVLVDSGNLRRAQDIIGQAYARARFVTPEHAAAYFLPYCLAMLDAGEPYECAEYLETISLYAEVISASVKPLFCRPAGALGGEGPALELERQYDEFARQTFTDSFLTRFAEELGTALASGIGRRLAHFAATGDAPAKLRERPDTLIAGMAELLEQIEAIAGPAGTADATLALSAALKTCARAEGFDGTYLHWDGVIRHARTHPELQAALLEAAGRNSNLSSVLSRQAGQPAPESQVRARGTLETDSTEPSGEDPPSPPPAPDNASAADIEPIPRPQQTETSPPSAPASETTEIAAAAAPASAGQDAAAAQERLARLETEVIALLNVPSVEASDYQFGRAQQDCRKALRTIDQEPALAHLRPAAQELLAWLDLAVTPEQRFVLEGHMATGEQTLLHIRDLLDQERISVRVGRLIRGYEVLEYDGAAGRLTLKRGTRTHYIYSR
jgi:hypothetical protein